MTSTGWQLPLLSLVLAATLATLPGDLRAQEEADSAALAEEARADSLVELSVESEVPREEMENYVALQLRVDELQEEAIQEMVRIHAESGRERVRNNLTEAIATAHEEHGMEADRAKRITFLVSSDPAVRALFDVVLQEAAEGESAS